MIARVRLAQDLDILQERRADRRSRPERLKQKDRVYPFFRKWFADTELVNPRAASWSFAETTQFATSYLVNWPVQARAPRCYRG